MSLIKTKKELQSPLLIAKENGSLGLVPTMGALHQGHISLVKKALSENDTVVVTIFVNPTQFDNKEDLDKYPDTLDADRKLLGEVSENLIIFAPQAKEIYGSEIESESFDFGGLDTVMEGAFREGHFEGVGTIVEKLLTLVQPARAYFGEKDFQQLQIIKKLVVLKNIPVAIIGCPIVREPSGLAMSSRNERLSSELREEASFIYKTLCSAKARFGTKSAQVVTEWVERQFEEHPDLELEYFMISDIEKLRPVQRKRRNKKYRGFIAVYAKDVRLIDNIALN
ncbi:pantoate--beta-alanine ligase [Maribacter sp. 2307UL18-2]|uniref:pantoate--beta-alanine ligase n=1 Tax=Maribacter sp. 2307UL18-2 TaxID=3386274 RepID=UPI0039BD158B